MTPTLLLTAAFLAVSLTEAFSALGAVQIIFIGFCRSTWIKAKYWRASLLDSFPPSGTLKALTCELFVKLHLVIHSMVLGSSDLDSEPQQGHHQRVRSCVCILIIETVIQSEDKEKRPSLSQRPEA